MPASLDHVFLAWRCRESRRILPIGRLPSFEGGGFEFAYVHSVEEAQQHGFRSFPDLGVVYRSKTLPVLFSNRVMRTTRPDYPAFVSELGLEPSGALLPSSSLRRTVWVPLLVHLDIFLDLAKKYPDVGELRVDSLDLPEIKSTFYGWYERCHKKIPKQFREGIELSADGLFEDLERLAG